MFDEILQLVNVYDHIQDNLFLGGQPTEIDNFKFVFNFSGTVNYYIPLGTQVVVRPFNDCPVIPDERMLTEMADLVLTCGHAGRTLVHCAAGINRSALVLALALIRDGVEPATAIALLRKQRGAAVLMNATFENWLLQRSPGRA